MSRMPRRSRMVAAAGIASLLAPIALLATPAAAAGDGGFGAFANPGETVTVEFPYRAEQYEWVVPDGVTEITVELAAGSGEAPVGDRGVLAEGGVGGHAVFEVPVVPGETLFLRVGASGATIASLWSDGGEGTAIARASEVLAVVGGGGGAYACLSERPCGYGGAGGLSLTSGSVHGTDSTWAVDVLPPVPLFSVGGGASGTAGEPGVIEVVTVVNGAVSGRTATGSAPATPAGGVSLESGLLRLSAPGTASSNRSATGGTGAFTGGTGATSLVEFFDTGDQDPETEDQDVELDVRLYDAGGGGGSGYLAPGVELLELRDNVGDGFATIIYTVPEPDVVESTEPALSLDEASVHAGTPFTLRGAGFDPDRDYPAILNSDPVLLGTVSTDAEGAFAATLTIPVSVPAGEHVLTVGDASIPITVLAAEVVAESEKRTILVADAPPAEPELAATGADPVAASILGLLAVALLAAGAAAVRASRQPQPVRQPRP
ncbi:hypothetical protein [Microcella sp.]|uniref:hypothetical protein n=1 Tax=Microcella sp. TaxID=1913979 RepID=UPI0039189E2A